MLLKIISLILLSWMPVVYAAAPSDPVVLSHKLEDIPRVLERLQQVRSAPEFSGETIDKVKDYFDKFTYETVFQLDEAHVVWRLMAALLASEDAQAQALYRDLLASGYSRKNDLLSAIGHQWGDGSSRDMNPAEQQILAAGNATQKTRQPGAVLRLLTPWVFDDWDKFLQGRADAQWWPLQHISYLTLQAYNFTPYLPLDEQAFLLSRMVQEAPYPLRDKAAEDVGFFLELHQARLAEQTKRQTREALQNIKPMVFSKPSTEFMAALEEFRALPVDQQPILSRTLPPEMNAKILRINQLWQALKTCNPQPSVSPDMSSIDAFKQEYVPSDAPGQPGKLLGLNLENIGRAYAHNFLLQTDLFQRLAAEHVVQAIAQPQASLQLFRVGNSIGDASKTTMTIANVLDYGIHLLGYSATQAFDPAPEDLGPIPRKLNAENIGRNIDGLLRVLEEIATQEGVAVITPRPEDMPASLNQTTDLNAMLFIYGTGLSRICSRSHFHLIYWINLQIMISATSTNQKRGLI